VTISQSIGDRESRVPPQVDVDDRTIQVRILDGFERAIHGPCRPDGLGSFGSKLFYEIHGEDVVVLDDQDTFAGKRVRHFCRSSAHQPRNETAVNYRRTPSRYIRGNVAGVTLCLLELRQIVGAPVASDATSCRDSGIGARSLRGVIAQALEKDRANFRDIFFVDTMAMRNG
jgi:hypothetical protein